MSIKIDRFECIGLKKVPTEIKIINRNSILIKDHTTDKFCSYVHLFNDREKNLRLAKAIIDTIEEFITDDAED